MLSTAISSIANLDPTNIASTVVNIALQFKTQYEQMESNRETCDGLNKQVGLIQKIVSDLNKTKQIDACKQTLLELHCTLISCVKLIDSIATKKNFTAKVKDFLSANRNKELIEKLTTQLRDMSDILNLALTAQTSSDVKEMMALISEKQAAKLPQIQRENKEMERKVDAFVQEINQIININNSNNVTSNNAVNVVINSHGGTTRDGRDSPDIAQELSNMRQGEQLHVLKVLKEFFRDSRDEGDKSKNFATYKKYIESLNENIGFSYNNKERRHILYINDEPLTSEDAVKEISKMIQSLKGAPVSVSAVMSGGGSSVGTHSSPILASPPGSNSANNNNLNGNSTASFSNNNASTSYSSSNASSSTMLNSPQANQIISPKPTVNRADVSKFLTLVVEGEQDQAEKMLKANKDLALASGDVTDLSKREFKNITGFQYAVWALDWHMWTMILKYLPENEAGAQAQGIESGLWVSQHNVHANWNDLIDAINTLNQNLLSWGNDQINNHWVNEVGRAQLLLPAHVVNEYCHPTRSFNPCPQFTKLESSNNWRIRTVEKGDWFTNQYNGGGLGVKFAYARGGSHSPGLFTGLTSLKQEAAAFLTFQITTMSSANKNLLSRASDGRKFEVLCLRSLFDTRIEQRRVLLEQLQQALRQKITRLQQ